MLDARRLQERLAVSVDGIIGANTLRALFARMGASASIAGELGLAANVHFRTYGILDSGLRLAHFMGQCAHESGGFRYMEEIASGQAYEGRKDLGNVIAGDGKRYKGRGPIQLTGRSNYRRVGRKIGIDLEGHPEIVSHPSLGLLVGCVYWDERGLNAKADADDLMGLTRAINGGTNGLEDRKAQTAKAKSIIL
ncbi:glycoside hydrolase family 19 protein [Brevundimonas sp. Bb-A]|uniref:glycoside hydrolase family 19 protein n=1 Tax=Brevundimonas sp. Bb-A TaxID=2560058 RepID=UPI0012A9F3DE|nr:glycoside hydrolase family 19 protein [Brevundimonas sp. Bb-A]QFU31492.1 Chitinase class I [Brevundimonas sp. Bb-A]